MHYYELKIYDEKHESVIFCQKFKHWDEVDTEIYRHMQNEKKLNIYKFMKRVHVSGLNGRNTIRLFDSDSDSETE